MLTRQGSLFISCLPEHSCRTTPSPLRSILVPKVDSWFLESCATSAKRKLVRGAESPEPAGALPGAAQEATRGFSRALCPLQRCPQPRHCRTRRLAANRIVSKSSIKQAPPGFHEFSNSLCLHHDQMLALVHHLVRGQCPGAGVKGSLGLFLMGSMCDPRGGLRWHFATLYGMGAMN